MPALVATGNREGRPLLELAQGNSSRQEAIRRYGAVEG
jgi:hypothetical protein